MFTYNWEEIRIQSRNRISSTCTKLMYERLVQDQHILLKILVFRSIDLFLCVRVCVCVSRIFEANATTISYLTVLITITTSVFQPLIRLYFFAGRIRSCILIA